MKLTELSKSMRALYAGAQKGIVQIYQEGESRGSGGRRRNHRHHGHNPGGSGKVSGVLWIEPGYIVTVSHPFDDPEKIFIVHGNDSPWTAEVVGWDNRFDIAVLKAEGMPAWKAWKDLFEVEHGDLVFSAGYREIRLGLVASVFDERETALGGIVKPWVEIDGTLSQSQNGGPLLDSDGNFLGVNSLVPGPQGQTLGFGQLQNIVAGIIKDGRRSAVFLGVMTVMAEIANGDAGLVVTKVEPGSIAEKSGLQSGDILLSLNDRQLSHPKALFIGLRSISQGDIAELLYSRGGEKKSVKIEF